MGEGNEQVHRPGEVVPVSGIYECDCGQATSSTDVKGHRFPPLQDGGSGWKLKTAAHPSS
ncbi:hypothetical protein ACGFXB_48535 [Streptomyces canus]|uniref:hypothetical protein n=1 Tax=Streptomyces canus TaxID=58343 RepID=UPI0037242ABF